MPSADLEQVGPAIICTKCRRPKLYKEKDMAEMKDKKKVASLHIYEIPTDDGVTDYEVVAEANYAGLKVEFVTTFDQVREFFTQKRVPGKRAHLKSV